MTRLEVAVEMAKIFRDKHDFSSKENYETWVRQSFEAADMLLAEDAKGKPAVIAPMTETAP